MKNGKVRFIYWQEEDFYIGYLEDYPDYQTQGESFEDLKSHLKDIYTEISEGNIPNIRKSAELEVS